MTKTFQFYSADQLPNLSFNPFEKIGKEWALITAGTKESFNTMTISWGFAGVMWGKNTFTTVIRPQRYTKRFVDDNEYFTVCIFDEAYHNALAYCGSHSGRDVDKAKEAGLSPLFLTETLKAYEVEHNVSTTAFLEASMILVCKKSYVQEMKPECIHNTENDTRWYPDKDYHVQYIGEILGAYVKKGN